MGVGWGFSFSAINSEPFWVRKKPPVRIVKRITPTKRPTIKDTITQALIKKKHLVNWSAADHFNPRDCKPGASLRQAKGQKGSLA